MPCSAVIRMARSSWFSSIRLYQLRRITARSLAVLARHAGIAALAASIVRRVSAAPILGTVPSNSPVALLVTSMTSPLSASTHSPLI